MRGEGKQREARADEEVGSLHLSIWLVLPCSVSGTQGLTRSQGTWLEKAFVNSPFRLLSHRRV